MARARGALSLLALLLGGCPAPTGSPAPGARGTAPQRILAMAPSAAEIAYELGLGPRVVGVGDYVRWPPEWSDKPRLGDLFHPQLERIAVLDPDLALLLPSEEALARRLRALDIEVLVVPSETLDDVEVAVREIAQRCGVPDAGDRLLARWRAALAPDPLPRPLRAVLVVGREPGRLTDLVVAGQGTFFDELLRRLGVENVFADVEVRYPQVSVEQIVWRRPEAIVELQPLELPQSRVDALRGDWAALPTVPAVASGCLPTVGGEYVLVPGPRLPRLYRELRQGLSACLGEPAPP